MGKYSRQRVISNGTARMFWLRLGVCATKKVSRHRVTNSQFVSGCTGLHPLSVHYFSPKTDAFNNGSMLHVGGPTYPIFSLMGGVGNCSGA